MLLANTAGPADSRESALDETCRTRRALHFALAAFRNTGNAREKKCRAWIESSGTQRMENQSAPHARYARVCAQLICQNSWVNGTCDFVHKNMHGYARRKNIARCLNGNITPAECMSQWQAGTGGRFECAIRSYHCVGRSVPMMRRCRAVRSFGESVATRNAHAARSRTRRRVQSVQFVSECGCASVRSQRRYSCSGKHSSADEEQAVSNSRNAAIE